MAGKPFRRGKSWSVVVELSTDPVTGERRQKWRTGATRKAVQEEQTRLLRERDTGTSLDPTKLTVAEYLGHWLETVVRPNRAILTYERREGTVRNHLVPAFGSVPLTKLGPATMEIYSHVTPGLQEGAALAFEATLKALTGRAEAATESGGDHG